jgi:hypothetical protein
VSAHADEVLTVLAEFPPHRVTSPIQLSWNPANPYAVEFRFTGAVEDVVWLIGRELLAEGLAASARVGVGDVRITPVVDFTTGQRGETIQVSLHNPTGRSCFYVGARALREFLDQTTARVPFGHELLWVPLDAAINSLFDDEGRPGPRRAA